MTRILTATAVALMLAASTATPAYASDNSASNNSGCYSGHGASCVNTDPPQDDNVPVMQSFCKKYPWICKYGHAR